MGGWFRADKDVQLRWMPIVGPAAWCVYDDLRRRARDGVAKATYAMITADTGMSQPTVTKAIRRLITEGLLTAAHHGTQAGVYHITAMAESSQDSLVDEQPTGKDSLVVEQPTSQDSLVDQPTTTKESLGDYQRNIGKTSKDSLVRIKTNQDSLKTDVREATPPASSSPDAPTTTPALSGDVIFANGHDPTDFADLDDLPAPANSTDRQREVWAFRPDRATWLHVLNRGLHEGEIPGAFEAWRYARWKRGGALSDANLIGYVVSHYLPVKLGRPAFPDLSQPPPPSRQEIDAARTGAVWREQKQRELDARKRGKG